MKKRGDSIILNVLTKMFMVIAVLALLGFAVIFFVPDILANSPFSDLWKSSEPEVPPTPTTAAVAVLPSPTQTPTPRLLVPTWTPAALEINDTATPAPTNTRGPTLTPSVVPTFPTKTPTPTHTPTATNTPTVTPIGPTQTASPTRSAFPFTKSDNSPFYLQNYANSAGCDWLGIAGEVLDLNRKPVIAGQYKVHVWDSGVDQRPMVGGAPAYSPSGWEQFVSNAPAIRNYNVQLETTSGTAVSQVYTVQTRASCNQNLVRLDFIQNH